MGKEVTRGTNATFQHALLTLMSDQAMQEDLHGCLTIKGQVCAMHNAGLDARLLALLFSRLVEPFTRPVRAPSLLPFPPRARPPREQWATRLPRARPRILPRPSSATLALCQTLRVLPRSRRPRPRCRCSLKPQRDPRRWRARRCRRPKVAHLCSARRL
jgi:hypothetical protein